MDPMARSRASRRRRVSVRTPSEEDAYETDVPLSPHRRRTRRRSSARRSVDIDSADEQRIGRGVYSRPATPGTPNNLPCNINIGHIGPNPVHNPVTAQLPVCLPGQQNVLVQGQPAPMMYHFLPQIAAGNCYAHQPPIVCALDPRGPLISGSFVHPLTGLHQSSRPLTMATQPLVVAGAGAGVPYRTTTMGYNGPEGIIAPREVIVLPSGAAGPLTSGPATAPFMPIMGQQPFQPGPMIGRNPAAAPGFVYRPPAMMMPGHGGIPAAPPMIMNGGHMSMMPGTFPGNQAGLLTISAQNRELNEPQDFRPADEDPARMYWVRQLDGHYVAMPRATIDAFGDEGARWYVTDDGVFYAVRLDG